MVRIHAFAQLNIFYMVKKYVRLRSNKRASRYRPLYLLTVHLLKHLRRLEKFPDSEKKEDSVAVVIENSTRFQSTSEVLVDFLKKLFFNLMSLVALWSILSIIQPFVPFAPIISQSDLKKIGDDIEEIKRIQIRIWMEKPNPRN